MVEYPKDWKECRLSNIVFMKSGESITAERIFETGKYPCFGGNGLRGYSENYTHEGDFALVGRQGALCGNVNIVSGKFFASEHAVVVTPLPGTDIKFMYYVLGRMNLNQYAESSAQPGLSVNRLLGLPCTVPCEENEQKAIAATLSTFDTHIDNLTALIEKKKAIRDGALADLMSGRTRLDGFSGEWEEVIVSDVADRFDNLRIPVAAEKRIKGNIPYYGANGIQDYVKGYTHDGEYILIAEDGANDLKKYPVNYVLGKVWVNNHAHVLRGKDNIADTKFLGLAMSCVDFEAVLVGGTRIKLNARTLMNMKLIIPTNLNEQKAIAGILTSMDTEIQNLETERDKFMQIREGAMDDLLTGRVRLPM